MEKVEKYSEQYWINRQSLIRFIGKMADCKELEKQLKEKPDCIWLKDSLYNLKKYVSENTPSIFADKNFYQIP